MKKFTFIAAASMLALAASAQYTVDPSTSLVIEKGPKTVDYLLLSDGAIADFEGAGAKVNYIGESPEEGRNLYIWEGTMVGYDGSYPRVDAEEGGYVSVQVADKGWSGAGFACAAPGINIEHFDYDTRFHIAYMTPSGTGPASIAIILFDGNASSPAKFALGDAFNDNGTIMPSLGEKISDDWQGVDVSLADIRKVWPTFTLKKDEAVSNAAWEGNIMEWLGGGVQGQTLAFDAMYFYTTKEAGVAAVMDDSDVQFNVTGHTVNVLGATGIQLYNVAGQLVKSTEGTTLGIDSLTAGVYVVKAAGKTVKVVIR